jgi:RNA polymerase sigma-70 factor, ECF subfamily
MSYPQCPLCAREEPCSCKELMECLEAFIPSVFEYLHNKRFDDEVIADACSLAWEAAIRWIGDGKAALMTSKHRRAYLCRTSRNIACSILRRKRRSLLTKAQPLFDGPPIEDDPSAAVIAAEEAATSERKTALLKECLAALNDDDRCLLELRHVDGSTYAQLGELLGRHEGTVLRRVKKAENRVREIFRSKERKDSPSHTN